MKNTNELAPSILSADFTRLGEQLLGTRDGGAKYVHIDVMDGHFVPEISFGEPIIRCVRPLTDQLLDVHLMVTNPSAHVQACAVAGADIFTFHYEAMPGGAGAYGGTADPAAALSAARELIGQIHEQGMQAGISVKPLTPVEALYPILPELDMVLIMTVEPGFGGQKYIPASTERIRTLREEAERVHPSLRIEVDGGIKEDNVQVVLEAGADLIVAGSAVYVGGASAEEVRGRTEAFMRELSRG